MFLRWGSEMNGDWVAWHGDSQLYIAKWRLVHDTLVRLAPNVIMVWCPNDVPRARIEAYYPGDAYVDWVGVNFYVVSIHDNDPQREARTENPADHLKWIYAKYAARKPLMICETGVTHEGQAVGREEVAFAAARIRQLYGSLPRLYPRVKALCYFDVNNLSAASGGRPFNNYLLTDDGAITEAYRAAIAPDYFLGQPAAACVSVATCVTPLADGMTVRGKVHLSAWAQARCLTPRVEYDLDGQPLGASSVAGSCDLTVDFSAVAPGPHRLRLVMRSAAGGRQLLEVQYSLLVMPPGGIR